MKRSICAVACLMVMVLSFVACSKDDEGLSKEQLAYLAKNREFIREKKALKDNEGNLVYKQLYLGGDTVLFRVLSKTGTETKYPTSETSMNLTLKGDLIDGKTFQPEFTGSLKPTDVILGLRIVMLENTVGEKIETIIPYTLGYGYLEMPGIPLGSTLIFTYTVNKFE